MYIFYDKGKIPVRGCMSYGKKQINIVLYSVLSVLITAGLLWLILDVVKTLMGLPFEVGIILSVTMGILVIRNVI